MSNADGMPSRRLRLVRSRRTAEESGPPRVDALDAFLREVDDLRLTLETDLTLAASAIESGSAEVASDILTSDRASLGEFQDRALGHLAQLDIAEKRHRRLRVPAQAGPILVAAALVGVLAGAAPQVLAPRNDGVPQTVAATDSLQRLQELAEAGDTAQVRAASLALHEQLAGVVARAKVDPVAAQTALMLLTIEQSTIVRSGDSRELADVLRQSQALVRAIVAALPKAARTVVPVAPAPQQQQPQHNDASAKPAPKPSASSSPKPKPSSQPSANPSPSASPSSSDDPYPLPKAPFPAKP